MFVLLATLLLLGGFASYLYHTAQRKGWFVVKVPYFTELLSGAGLKVGDPVKLMGFDVGEITRVTGLSPDDIFNVYVEFEIRRPYDGYLWTHGSFARVAAADFLGKRALEVTKGDSYLPAYLFYDASSRTVRELRALSDLTNKVFLDNVRGTNGGPPLAQALRSLDHDTLNALAQAGVQTVRVADKSVPRPYITYVWDLRSDSYQPFHRTNLFWLMPLESPALTEELGDLVTNLHNALPGILNLTNQLAQVLSNAASLTAHADALVVQTRPAVSNLAAITDALREPNGSLGQWLLPTNLHAQLLTTLTNANGTLTNASLALTAANTNLGRVVAELNGPLRDLGLIISNLNHQVQANTNLVTTVHTLLADVDDFVQGLKRHWLFRSAFRTKSTNAPPPRPYPRVGGKP